MNDDPSVKEVLTAAADIPRKVGKSLLEAKLPVGRIKRAGEFAVRHWLSAVLSFAILLWTASHYVSQLEPTRWMCHGPNVTFQYSANPDAAIVFSNAIAISPISQAISSWRLSSDKGTYDDDFDVKKFIQVNNLDISYLSTLSIAFNADYAKRLVQYRLRQEVARCIASESGLTLVVVFGHGLIAYLVFLAILPARRRTPAT